jgi:hypothetical protein
MLFFTRFQSKKQPTSDIQDPIENATKTKPRSKSSSRSHSHSHPLPTVHYKQTRFINKYCEDHCSTYELFGDFKSTNPRKLHGKNIREIAEMCPKVNPQTKERLYGRGWYWELIGTDTYYYQIFKVQYYLARYNERFARFDVEYVDTRDEKGNLIMLPSVANGLTTPGYRWVVSYIVEGYAKWFSQEKI